MPLKDSSISSNSISKKKPESTTCNLFRDTDKAGIDHDAAVSSPLLVKDVVCEDDKGKIMEEVMKTYVKQQEKLNSILQKKQQLQMVKLLSKKKPIMKRYICTFLMKLRMKCCKLFKIIHLCTHKLFSYTFTSLEKIVFQDNYYS